MRVCVCVFQVNLTKVEGTPQEDIPDGFSLEDVGYNPEIYMKDELQKGGLKIKRDQEGKIVAAPYKINQSV